MLIASAVSFAAVPGADKRYRPAVLAFVLDISPGAGHGLPINLDHAANVDGILFFVGADPAHGSELWKTDGTAKGTVLVKDITPGTGSTNFNQATAAHGFLYFSANGGLWKSDGTDKGTVLVMDGVDPFWITEADCYGCKGVVFAGTDAAGGYEPWKSDGTAKGTVRIKDVRTGNQTSDPQSFVFANGIAFFVADDGAHGRELWASDLSDAGTKLVKDIHPDPQNPYPPRWLTAVGDRLYFVATTPENGEELWRSDGTEAGTVLVQDINPGKFPSNPEYLTNADGTLYFTAFDPGVRQELFKVDPGSGAVSLVKDINTTANVAGGTDGSFPKSAHGGQQHPLLHRRRQYERHRALAHRRHRGGHPHGERHCPWHRANQHAAQLVDPASFVAADGNLFFIAWTATSGYELWTSDGTEAGTKQLTEIRPGKEDAVIGATSFQYVNTRLFFSADDGAKGREL